ncbi:MAG: MFS transporter [Candidatus Bathyarchaeota archaeon]|nr:MFS transporter [Candidatus Bathyarchaeota archaeon]MDH5494554.1 MFS transporter [Candidatus Bathyarchaeota archaeon]
MVSLVTGGLKKEDISVSETIPDNSETTRFSFRSMFKGNLVVLGASNIARGFGSGLISAYMSLYFVGLGGSPLMLGVMIASSSIIGAFMFLFGGVVADYYGRRAIVVTSAFYAGFFPLLYVFTLNWRLFVVLSLGAAIGSISTPASRALVVDSISPERRTTGIAVLQVVSSLPATFSPLVGGWLIQNYGLIDGFKLACVYTGATAFISAFILLLFLRETLWYRQDSDMETSHLGKLKNVIRLRGLFPTGLKALMLSYALIAFANAAVGPYYILYASSIIGLTPLQWAPIACIQSLSITLKIPGGWLSDKFGKRNVMIFSLLACAPCTILFSLARSFFQTLVVAVLLIITGIYYAPAHEALQADFTPRRMRGRITALWQLSGAIFSAFGTLTGGFLFQVDPTTPFYLFTAAELVSAVLLVSLVREPKRREI